MKQPAVKIVRLLFTGLLLFAAQLWVSAQDVKVDQRDISSWFATNWMWVVAGVILLILIMAFSGGRKNRSKSTTVVKDEFGNVKTVKTEVKET